MKNIMKFLLSGLICLALFSACKPSLTDKLTYEIINGERHITVSRANLITLCNSSADDIKDLMDELNYKKNEKTKQEFSFIQKTDTVSGVFQILTVRNSNTPEQVVDIMWVSFDKKDRFKTFKDDIIKHKDIVMKKGDTFILKQEKKQYMASLKDLIIGKQISIIEMK